MSGGNKKFSVLVVEDDPENLRFLTTLLSKYFNVISCRTESEFFNLIISNRFDVVLMDISLSAEKSGLSLIKSFRQIPLFKAIPVICLSAHISESDKSEALEAGANCYLTKPVQNKALIETIFSFLETNEKSKSL